MKTIEATIETKIEMHEDSEMSAYDLMGHIASEVLKYIPDLHSFVQLVDLTNHSLIGERPRKVCFKTRIAARSAKEYAITKQVFKMITKKVKKIYQFESASKFGQPKFVADSESQLNFSDHCLEKKT